MVSEQPLPTRAERATQTRKELVAAAREVFLDRGYHATSLGEVSRHAGYTKGAVYAHFRDKPDLFLCVLEEGVRERVAALTALESLASRETLVRRLVRNWQRTNRGDARWWLLVLEFRVHAARDPDLSRRHRALHAELVTAMRRLLEAHGFDASDSLAHLVLALGAGAALERASGAKLGRTPEHALHALLEGLA